MIEPTIGRKVWFWPQGLAREPNEQPMDANVVYVHSTKMINVAGFDHNGAPFARTSVPLLQDGDSGQGLSCYAEWMPFQKGQAANADTKELKTGNFTGG